MAPGGGFRGIAGPTPSPLRSSWLPTRITVTITMAISITMVDSTGGISNMVIPTGRWR
jgi:hypothetical protein